jgi:hypothetical protein
MKQRPQTQPAALTLPQPVNTLPCLDKLLTEQRQALIIALTTVMVKSLPDQRRPQGVDDA